MVKIWEGISSLAEDYIFRELIFEKNLFRDSRIKSREKLSSKMFIRDIGFESFAFRKLLLEKKFFREIEFENFTFRELIFGKIFVWKKVWWGKVLSEISFSEN